MIVLGSRSPRRRHLLERLEIPFDVDVSDVFERPPHENEDPAAYAIDLATTKARAVYARRTDDVVLAADTVVHLPHTIFGKPLDAKEAFSMLRTLIGRTHHVTTAVVVLNASRCYRGSRTTSVVMRTASETELRAYIATGEPMDKAGGYGIQGEGRTLVETVVGCFENVVGLPLCLVQELFVRACICEVVQTAVCTHRSLAAREDPHRLVE